VKQILVTLVILYGDGSIAAAPTKSSVCALTLNAIYRVLPEDQSSTYTLNSLRAFRENVLKIAKIPPDVPEGFSSDCGYTSGYTKYLVGKRIAGIESFATRENADLKKRNFIRALVLSGGANIENFIDSLLASFDSANRTTTRSLLNEYRALFFAAALLLPVTANNGFQGFQSIGTLTVLTSLSLASKADHLLWRPLYKDREVRTAFASMKEVLRTNDPNAWAIYSRNAYLSRDLIQLALQRHDNEDLETAIAEHSQREVPALLRSLDGPPPKTDWAGVDFFLEKTSGGNPELHVIFRGSERRPVSPKRNKSKAGDHPLSAPEVVPELAPGLSPGFAS